jgi:hypothetical protein
MLRNPMKYSAVLACGMLTLAGLSAMPAGGNEDKGKPALSGSWVKQEGELKIEFADKDVLKIAPHGNEDVFVVVCSYTAEKGVVKARITGLQGKQEVLEKAKDKVPVGSEFRFKWEVKGDTGTLDDVAGEKADILKTHLEGKYDKK